MDWSDQERINDALFLELGLRVAAHRLLEAIFGFSHAAYVARLLDGFYGPAISDF